MLKRTITAVSIIAVLIGMVVLGYFVNYVFVDLVILAFATLAIFEMYNTFKKSGNNVMLAPVIILVVTAYPVFYVMQHFAGERGLFGLFIAFLFSAAVAVTQFTFSKNEREMKDLALTIFMLVYPYMLVTGAFVLTSHFYSPIFCFLLIVALPVFTDTFAYYVGSTFKGPKLCPEISPKKTISGAIGGLFGGVLAGIIFFLIFDLYNLLPMLGYVPFTASKLANGFIFAGIGLLGAVVSQLGDISASKIKRKLGIKDYGNIFPGHGGAMDRIDSIMYMVVLLCIVFPIIYYI